VNETPTAALRLVGPAKPTSTSGNAGEEQAFAIVVAILRELERVCFPELCDGEIRFERQEFLDVRRCILPPSEMAERRDHRFVSVDEFIADALDGIAISDEMVRDVLAFV
jgi:hypothetical protein